MAQMVPTRSSVHICSREPIVRVGGGYDLWFPLVWMYRNPGGHRNSYDFVSLEYCNVSNGTGMYLL